MKKLYDVCFTDKTDRKELYYKSSVNINILNNNSVILSKNTVIDLITYFNSFSLYKWKKYTTIENVIICGAVYGNAEIEIIGLSNQQNNIIKREIISEKFKFEFKLSDLQYEIIGIKITALEDNCKIYNISYNGDFENYQNKNIGIVICTFNRQRYVTKLIEKFKIFQKNHQWLSVIVVDNGRNLTQYNDENFKLLYNPNYGGSGGFTRGMMEYVTENKVEYILLMDDDIDIDITTLERTHSLVCGIKDKYIESFLSGAMLIMDNPTIQKENMAYWNKIRLHSLGCGLDLSKTDNLLINEQQKIYINQYPAWWFCVIPLERIKVIGYPLPIFIKGDDIEYGIRNDRPIINMNGIAVWHEDFRSKANDVINYFSDRNMLMINQYAKGCNRTTLFVAIIGRLYKHLLDRNYRGIKYLDLAVSDFADGLYKLVQVPSDEKFIMVHKYNLNYSSIKAIVNIVFKAILCLFTYKNIKNNYLNFRTEKLQTQMFWNEFLKKR